MAELTLRPDGEGDKNEHLQLPDSGEHYDKVDEVVADDGTTYVYGVSTVGSEDLYTLPAHGLAEGTVINNITLHGRFYRGYSSISFGSTVKWFATWTGGSGVWDTDLIYSEWYTDSYELLVNPTTNEHWTLAELASMQIGTALSYAFSPNVEREGRNSQLYIVVEYSPSVSTPTVTTDPATEITTVAATLNGTLDDDGGESCDCGFEWGETDSYGNTTSTQSKTTGLTFSKGISGLSPNTTYHFWALATNSAGTGYGEDRTFTTLVAVPTVTTNPATDVLTTSATLNGTLDNDGGEACDCGFEYGLNTNYGTTTSTDSKETGGTFSQAITDLLPNTTYHFRAIATNSAGTSYGEDRTFKTLSGGGGVGVGGGAGGGVGGDWWQRMTSSIMGSLSVTERLDHLIATDLEQLVINWLTHRKIIFEFQSSLMGGFYELGGAVVDFLLNSRGLAWRVMGEYWHTGVEAEAHDLIQKELLSNLGWQVVDLWGQDLRNRLDLTLTKALRGEEMLRETI